MEIKLRDEYIVKINDKKYLEGIRRENHEIYYTFTDNPRIAHGFLIKKDVMKFVEEFGGRVVKATYKVEFSEIQEPEE